MSKKRYSILIILLTIIIVVLTTVIIYNIEKVNAIKESKVKAELQNVSISNSNQEKIKNNEEVIKTNNAQEVKISPNALITFNKYYKSCKHTIISREDVNTNMVNLTKEEFEKLYSDWKITKFTSTDIELYKEFEGECNEHYIVKEEDGVIAIYKQKSNNEMELIEKTEISTNCLPQMDLNQLKEGVKLVGQEELNGYLENFE